MRRTLVWSVIAVVMSSVLAWSESPDDARLPADHPDRIEFRAHVQPILASRCGRCHSGPSRKGGYSMNTRASFIAGGESGPAVIVGDSGASHLIELLETTDIDDRMPKDKAALDAERIRLLRRWIDAGLEWPESISLAPREPAPVRPRAVELPPLEPGRSAHPIDRLLDAYGLEHDVTERVLVDDATFARRVWLDIIGLLPPVDPFGEFLEDDHPDKRARLIDRLFTDRDGVATHWLTFWNDLLRNAYRGTGYIDGGRRAITPWLYRALAEDRPYDVFTRELIDPGSESNGFIRGIKWRGTVNDSQRRELQAAQNVAQVFLGTNLKCASCHDSFVNHWRLADAYGLASVFADESLELHRCDQPTGRHVPAAFIYPELGKIDATLPRAQRQKRLAELVTTPDNGRFARTIVNRLWAKLLGRGIVATVDDMDQEPWNADLLDWLADDFVMHGDDIEHTLRTIFTSRAYQLASVSEPLERPTDGMPLPFCGPVIRRLTAEQFVDAVCQLTRTDAGPLVAQLPERALPTSARWIWNATGQRPRETVRFRKTIEFDEEPTSAFIVITCDNAFTLLLNGAELAGGSDWKQPQRVELRGWRVGDNVLEIIGVNSAPSPAALFVVGELCHDEETTALVSDASWQAKSEGVADATWCAATELDAKGWDNTVGAALRSAYAFRGRFVRAALTNDDALTRVLGRPNREQVVTQRDSLATTLQALELTNGSALASRLKHGAHEFASFDYETPDDLITDIYVSAVAREPTVAELAIARDVVGDALEESAIEDLLWIVVVSPSFQLIH